MENVQKEKRWGKWRNREEKKTKFVDRHYVFMWILFVVALHKFPLLKLDFQISDNDFYYYWCYYRQPFPNDESSNDWRHFIFFCDLNSRIIS